MRILYVGPYPPAQDGIGTYTRILAQGNTSNGHDIRVILPHSMAGLPQDIIGCLGLRRTEREKAREAAANWAPDVVHVQFAVAAFGTRALFLPQWLDSLGCQLRVPVIITLHEVTSDIALLGKVGRAFYRKLVSRSDHVVVHTKSAYDVLTRVVGVQANKVAVIPHPSVQPPAGTSTPGDLRARYGLGNARILLAFGFIHVDKGLDDLICALSILRRTGAASLNGVRVVVAGAVRPRRGLFRVFEVRDRLYAARVLRAARRRSLQQLLVMTGYVPDDDVAAWFYAAEAVVLPYRRTEQSGVANLSTAFAVPVLASTVGGLADLFAGSRWTFPPRSPECLARAIAEFLNATPAEQALDGRHGGLIASLDLDSVTAATFQLYRTACDAYSFGNSHAT